MARIRSVHPGLASDEAFMSMSMPCKAAWPLLWTECDDNGVFEWKPIVLKARIFPADNVDFSTILAELEALECVKRVMVEGKPYGVVRNFGKYQRPKNPSYRYALPDEHRLYAGFSDSPPPALPQPSPSPTEKPPQRKEGIGIGREEERERERASAPATAVSPKSVRGTRLPADWRPTDDDMAFATSVGFSTSQAEAEFSKFRDYWIAKAGAGGVKSDWPATARNWMRRASETRGTGPPRVATLKFSMPSAKAG